MKPFPPYPANPRKHGGGARIVVNGVPYYLGKHGSPASLAEYERLQREHTLGRLPQKGKPAPPKPREFSVRDLVAEWYKQDPRDPEDGEVIRTCRACTPLIRLFGALPAKDFSARHLQDVQEAMITRSWMTDEERGKWVWSGTYINDHLGRIRRVFRWAETKGHVPRGTWDHLRTLAPVKRTDRRVKWGKSKMPCDWEKQVVPALKEMYPQVAAMVLVQFYGGMRPGEVVVMRRCEIDTNGPHGTWLYTPTSHKNSYRGHDLVKVLGPKAQEAMREFFLRAEPDGFVFPPVRDRWDKGRFRVQGYYRAVVEACAAARVPRFTPYQLRHLAKQVAKRQFGLDDARAFLGQASLGAANEYAQQIDLESAAKVAVKIGLLESHPAERS